MITVSCHVAWLRRIVSCESFLRMDLVARKAFTMTFELVVLNEWMIDCKWDIKVLISHVGESITTILL